MRAEPLDVVHARRGSAVDPPDAAVPPQFTEQVPSRTALIPNSPLTWAVNHLALFLLTTLLLDRLKASAPARIITTSSAAHRGARIPWGDLRADSRFQGFRRYGQSKLATILFTARGGRAKHRCPTSRKSRARRCADPADGSGAERSVGRRGRRYAPEAALGLETWGRGASVPPAPPGASSPPIATVATDGPVRPHAGRVIACLSGL